MPKRSVARLAAASAAKRARDTAAGASAAPRTPAMYARSYKGGGAADWHLPLLRAARELAGLDAEAARVLYPGCWAHLTPSLVFARVRYVDSDAKVAAFFRRADVAPYLAARKEYAAASEPAFERADFRALRGAAEADLLLSLSAGPVEEHCGRLVRPGGFLLASDAHADARAAFARPDGRWELVAWWDAAAGRFDADTARCFVCAGDGRRITAAQAAESQRVGAKARRSFRLEHEPMVYLLRRRTG